MTEGTLHQEQEQPARRLKAAECARGHWNEPYPDNGKCTVCGLYLAANPDVLTSESAAEYRGLQAGGARSREEIARAILEDEGIPWEKATEGLRQLSLQFAKSKNTKTLELILQQIGVLKAKPKPGEEQQAVEYQAVLTAGGVAALERSLAVLQALLEKRGVEGV